MAKAESKSFGKADEVRQFPKGRLELVQVGGATIGRAVFEPGWRWASSIQPLVKTKSCEAPHFQYDVSGVLRIRMDDDTEFECKPGDISLLPSGHDAWVVGNKTAVVVDFQVSPELAPLANPKLMALSDGSILQDLDKLPKNQFRPPTFPVDRSFRWQPATIVSTRSPQEAL
jgi:hypothetical protein